MDIRMPAGSSARHFAAVALLGAALLATGCRQRTLSWRSADPGRLASARTVAVVDPRLSPEGGPAGQLASAVANDVASEFMRRGYRVKFIGRVIQANVLTDGKIDIDPGVPTTLPAEPLPTDAMERARDMGAELLCEVFLQMTPHVNVQPLYGPPYGTFDVYMGPGGYYYGAWPRRYPWGWPRYVDEYDVSYALIVESATLRLVTVHEGYLLATASVRYHSREDDPADIAADLMMGVDAVRQSRADGAIDLKTRPGEWPDKEDDEDEDERNDEEDE
jgi:hypothetical protein